jgi:hypothetical protein
MSHVLDREYETYEKYRARLVAEHDGEYVVIKGEEVIGVWPTVHEALVEAGRRFPFQPVMVDRISAVDEVVTMSANVRFP